MDEKRFGTFEGVFTPALLSILGVVMYLRLGWVVGKVGLGQALCIIVISNLITIFTGLSIASIITNIRIGTGGAYSIISKSLGLEVGGAIGIPLYFSQAISVAFYITGFSECWISIFPRHDFIFVSLIVWLALLIISYTSARLAFRLQYGVMAIIAFSLVSAFLGKTRLQQPIIFWQGTGDLGFWRVFAIFFPAVTGILAGVSMSGELKDPERNIPLGTLSAIGISFLIYVFLASWFAHVAKPHDLVNNTAIIIELARWRFLVIAGIMGATLSSALSMFVASSRTLLALGKHRIIPLSASFNRINIKGEPAPAILFTACLSLLAISLGTLNNIAGVLTMFFLITYGMLNISVFIEQGIGIVSFRPAFKIPLIFSLLGGLGCIYAMFLINQVFSVIAIITIVLTYILLLQKHTQRNWPDVRKGLFIFVAEQAVKIASKLPYHPKIWKPNLVIPVDEPRDWPGIVEFIKAIASPNGRLQFFKIIERPSNIEEGNKDIEALSEAKKKLAQDLSVLTKQLEEDTLVSSVVAESEGFLEGATVVLQTLKGAVLPPNVLFLKLGLDADKDGLVKELIKKAAAYDLGIMVFRLHPKVGLSQKQLINFWVRRGSPNVNLALLVALQLEKNWEAKLRILQVVADAREQIEAQNYLNKLKKVMRLPIDAEVCVLTGNFEEVISVAPVADINIFGMSQDYDTSWMRKISDKANTSVLFLKDSKQESAIV